MSRPMRLLTAFVFLSGLIVLGVVAPRWQKQIDPILRPLTDGLTAIDDVTVTLFFSDSDAQCLWAETRVLPGAGIREGRGGREDSGDVDKTEDIALRILDALSDGPMTDELVRTIPPGARVRSVTIEDGLAVVDYSAELRTNHPGGSAGELMTAYSIVGSLAVLDGVDAVQILLEGEVIDSLVGHLIFSEPMTVSEDALQAGRICW